MIKIHREEKPTGKEFEELFSLFSKDHTYFEYMLETAEVSLKRELSQRFSCFKIKEAQITDRLTEENIESLCLINSKPYINFKDELVQVFLSSEFLEFNVIDLNKSIFEKGNGNFREIWLKYFDKSLYDFILSKIHSRYTVNTKISLIRSIFKIQWADKKNIKRILKQVIDEVGIKEVMVKTNSGKFVKSLAPNKFMIHMSCRPSVVASIDWAKEFPEEFEKKELFIQGGGYTNSFFIEVFPQIIPNEKSFFSSYVRVEADTLENTEKKAFEKLKKIKSCVTHDWDRRDRDNGHAFCKKCGVFNSKALDPLTTCAVCKKPTVYNSNKEKMYCEDHFFTVNANDIESTLKSKEAFGLNRVSEADAINYDFRNKYSFSEFEEGKEKKKIIKKAYVEFASMFRIKRSNLSKRSRDFDNIYKHNKHLFFVKKILLKNNKVSIEELKKHRSKDSLLLEKMVLIFINQFSILKNNSSGDYKVLLDNLRN